MKLRVSLAVTGGLVLAACSDSSTVGVPNEQPAFLGVQREIPAHIHVMPTKAVAAGQGRARLQRPRSNTGISYHGGPIIASTKVASIYWGTGTIYNGGPTPGSTGSGTQDGSLVGFFLRNLGGSKYFNINSTYYNGSGVHVANSIAYAGFWADNSDPGSSPSDAAIQAEVIKAFTSNKLTFDASTVYLVFTGSGVNLGGGFGTQYCAYHGHFTWSGNDVKYAAEPYDGQFPGVCTANAGSPNNDAGADAVVNTVAHETEEAATDPDLNAWFDTRGYENADKCAWNFGQTYSSANGATANMNLGGKDFLIQMNWVNAGSGGCLLAYP